MEFVEEFHPRFKSDLKKIDKGVIKKLKEIHLDIILKNPMCHDKLKGRLSHIYSYHFRENSTQYRIAYEVFEDEKVVFHYMVATRENFYQKLKDRIL